MLFRSPSLQGLLFCSHSPSLPLPPSLQEPSPHIFHSFSTVCISHYLLYQFNVTCLQFSAYILFPFLILTMKACIVFAAAIASAVYAAAVPATAQVGAAPAMLFRRAVTTDGTCGGSKKFSCGTEGGKCCSTFGVYSIHPGVGCVGRVLIGAWQASAGTRMSIVVSHILCCCAIDSAVLT